MNMRHRHKRDLQHLDNDYIALLGLDFSWDSNDVEKITAMWKNGINIEKIADRFSRPVDEVFILLLDLARKNKISERPGGIY